MRTISCLRRVAIAAGLVAALVTPAVAQDTDTDMYDGKYQVHLQGLAAGYQSAQLVIFDYGGTWRDTSRKAGAIDKACLSKTFPVTVQRSSKSSFEFTVWGTSVSPACPDLTVSMKPKRGKEMEGTVDQTGSIRLVRQK